MHHSGCAVNINTKKLTFCFTDLIIWAHAQHALVRSVGQVKSRRRLARDVFDTAFATLAGDADLVYDVTRVQPAWHKIAKALKSRIFATDFQRSIFDKLACMYTDLVYDVSK